MIRSSLVGTLFVDLIKFRPKT